MGFLVSPGVLEEFNEKLNLPKRSLSKESAATLQSMNWQGNIRQLRNIIERILIMGPDHGFLTFLIKDTKMFIFMVVE